MHRCRWVSRRYPRAFWSASGVLAAIASLAAAPAAVAAPAYSGGSLPEAAVTGAGYSPTVGVTLAPRADGRVALAFDTTLRCGRAVTLVRTARVVAWDGATLSAAGVSRAPFAGRRVRYSWLVQAHADGQSRPVGPDRGAAPREAVPRPRRAHVVARLGRLPRAHRRVPAAGAAYYGGGPRLVAGPRPGSRSCASVPTDAASPPAGSPPHAAAGEGGSD